MARSRFQAPTGTRDLLEPDTSRIRAAVDAFADKAGTAGFGQIVPPMFEDSGVFVRLGEASDVVSKELYEFEDKGGRSIALRPEFTASVCRAFAELRPLVPWKVWYVGPSFRYDKPQKGRYRQFDQVGAEALGSDDPELDVELIALAWRFFADLGLTDVTLMVNSLGDFADRPRYLEALTAYFESRLDELSEQARATLVKNPLRVLDSKRDVAVAAEAPILADFLSEEAADAFATVTAGLDLLGIPYTVEPRLVRGLDYYTRTTFEFVSSGLDAAQTAIGGGGRYDGLVEALGGPAVPGVGFALGVDRTLLACDAAEVFPAPSVGVEVWVVSVTEGPDGLALSEELRAGGVATGRAYDGRSMKAQMKAADRSGARIAVIVGEDEVKSDTVSVRSLRGDLPGRPEGEQQMTVARSEVVASVSALLG